MTEISPHYDLPTDAASPDSERMQILGRLVGGVAHDFNNLLTGITLYCDLLVPALKENDRLRNYVEEIRKASAGGGALIQQLLAVARNQPTPEQRVCLNEVVSQSHNLLSRLIGENIELVCDLAEEIAEVQLEPAQAQQLLLNLVLNGRDAMPNGGALRVTTRNCSSSAEALPGECATVELTVEDTGEGMNSETRNHLFERFFTTKAPGKGNGLGLSIVGGIVRRGGGTICVESEPGRGTKFVIQLPCVKPRVSLVQAQENILQDGGSSPLNQVSGPRRKKTA